MSPVLAVESKGAPAQNVPIVAIGASAGGITVLQKLFQALPADLPFAFVVLQHLPADAPSGLANLIRRWTPMPVRCATNDAAPQANCVYLPSPDHILTIEHDVFRTRPAAGGGRRPGIDTIDAFLETLAKRGGSRPVAIILSGTGMDGTAGAICIRQAEGIVIVQDPLTALHDSMPNSVIQRDIHDHVLPVGAIGQQLMACAAPGYRRPARSVDWAAEMTTTLKRIIELIRQKCGFDLSGYKPSPLFWRIQQRMETRKVWAFDDYAALLDDDPVELEALVRGIPIHVTEFFRDAEAWEELARAVLDRLMKAARRAGPLRVWTPACSTGEEAYSIAMLLDEMSRQAPNQARDPADFQIFATDAAPELIAKASRGVFRADALTAISSERQSRYFYKVDAAWRVKRSLREKLVFVPQDLIADPPFSGLDLISCRNLLIYLEPETVDAVLRVLHASLRMGGFLFLGKSEAYPLDRQAFEPVSKKWNIYRKVGPMSGTDKRRASPRAAAITNNPTTAALRIALEQFDVPSVLIDEQCNVLRVYGNVDQTLRLPAGEPTLNLPDLVPRNWAAHLRCSIGQAFAEREALTITRLYDRLTGEATLSVRVVPLQMSQEGRWDRAMVSFIRAQVWQDWLDTREPRAEPVDVCDVSDALVDWQDEARISREELEASREELQAVNEQLRASNEQLNESNHDLNDANTRLTANVAQLAMQSRVLLSGAVMTMFLDRDSRLRWFTPAMSEVFPLDPTDLGRRITDLVPRFRDQTFEDDIRKVLAGSPTREAVVRRSHHQCLMRNTRPYLGENDSTAGVAITYFDITARERAEAALRRSEQWLCAQNEAFRAAMNGASLDISLGILIRSLIEQANDARRCAFYIADGDVLRHVVGMSDEYARCVDGFRISPESLACGLAVATGEPVVTPDILQEPRWVPWTWLARQFNYRGCWSFPVETSEGNLVGSLAMYFEAPHEPSAPDRALASAFTQTAAIIIWRHLRDDSTT